MTQALNQSPYFRHQYPARSYATVFNMLNNENKITKSNGK